jgi:peptidoglycan/LPS O-acetylase OafA/YrhL
MTPPLVRSLMSAPPAIDYFLFGALLHAPSFLFGAAAGQLMLQLRARPAARWLARSSALALFTVVAVLSLGPRLPFLALFNGLIMPLFAWLLVGLSIAPSPAARLLGDQRLVLLGEASYGVYILHWPIHDILVRAARAAVRMETPGRRFIAVYVAVTIAASLLTYRFVEAPARAWLRRRLSPSS